MNDYIAKQIKKVDEYHKEIANKIIEQIMSGKLDWIRPWSTGIFPHNLEAKESVHYQGINICILAMAAAENHYEDPRWLTFNQARKLNLHVKKGAKCTRIEVWRNPDEEKRYKAKKKGLIDDKEDEDSEDDKEKKKSRVYHGFDYLFNAEQVEGLEPYKQPERTWKPCERAETVIKASGVTVYHDGGDSAFYRPSTDDIHLPALHQFPAMEEYYSTVLHELSHSTGHPSRLKRDISNSFGSPGYAKEELRAELGSIMLCTEVGIDRLSYVEKMGAAYMQSWLAPLKEDFNEIFRAAADANKICKFLLEKERVYLKTIEQSKMDDKPKKNLALVPKSRDSSNQLGAEL